MHIEELRTNIKENTESLSVENSVQKDLRDCLRYGLLVCDVADIYAELSTKLKDNTITVDEFGQSLDDNLHKLEKTYRDLF